MPKPEALDEIINKYELIEGSGTDGDPYQIATAKQLDEIVRLNLTASYILVEDIDLSELKTSSGAQKSWEPIGPGDTTKTRFTGTFNGNGHTISNMKITGSYDNVGLFGSIGEGGEVSNLILKDYLISGGTSGSYIGSLAGRNYGKVSKISAIGKINNSNDIVASYIGGLVGYNSSTGNIENTYTGGSIIVSNAISGGITGYCNNSGTITNSYSETNIKSTKTSANVGGISGNYGMITNCYYTGKVSGSNYVAGIIYSSGTATSSYWCSDILTPTAGTKKGVGLTGSEMQSINSYVDWDISSDENANTTWIIREGEYPKLRWMKDM